MSDDGAGDFLVRLTAKLAGAGVPNMVVGSFASSFHGIPRSSQDVDLVIDPDAASLRRFLAELPADDYYADADAAFDALQRRGQFNAPFNPAPAIATCACAGCRTSAGA
jgi:hypothetical protein